MDYIVKGNFNEADLLIWSIVVLTITVWNNPMVIFNLGISDKMRLCKFIREPFDTYTGIVTGGQAWVQICLIPVALFVCTIAMGLIVTFAV